jgi:hypothetical protein
MPSFHVHVSGNRNAERAQLVAAMPGHLQRRIDAAGELLDELIRAGLGRAGEAMAGEVFAGGNVCHHQRDL